LSWEGEEGGYEVPNRVTKVMVTGLDKKFTEACIQVGASPKQKIKLIQCHEYTLLEFVAMANKNWKIVLN